MWPDGGSPVNAWIFLRTASAPASMWRPSCCTCGRGSKAGSRRRSSAGRDTPTSCRTRRRIPSAWKEASGSYRVPCADGSMPMAYLDPTTPRKSCGSICQRVKPLCSASRNWSHHSWKRVGVRRSVFPCGASTSKRFTAANGPPAKRSCRCSLINARECSTSPSPNAPCWPMKWAWARRSRPSPLAPCCTGWAKRGGCWSSRPPRSKANGRSKSSGSRRSPTNWCTANATPGWPATARTRRSSRSPTSSRWCATLWMSTRACAPTWWCSTRRSASRTGTPRPARPSSACKAATPSC